MKRALVALAALACLRVAVADPAGCTTWNLEVVGVPGSAQTVNFGDSDQFCVNAMLDVQAHGFAWRGSCHVTHYAATYSFEAASTNYDAVGTRNGCSASDTETFTLDWSDQSHVMQALIVMGCVFVFVMGYSAGDKA